MVRLDLVERERLGALRLDLIVFDLNEKMDLREEKKEKEEEEEDDDEEEEGEEERGRETSGDR